MADIAFLFHWPPGVMERMSIEELTGWWHRALDRVPGKDEDDG